MSHHSSDDMPNRGRLVPTIRVAAHRLPRSQSVPHADAAGSSDAIAEERTLVRGTQRLTISGSMADNGSALPVIRAAVTRVTDAVRDDDGTEREPMASPVQPRRSLPSTLVPATRCGTTSRDRDTGR
jgi:hypothetical protein